MELVGHGVNLSGASQCFPSSPGSSFANIPNGVSLASSKRFPSPRSCSSYASILRGKILGANRGIPFDDTADGEILAPSIHLPLQSPELVNQLPDQIQSSFAGLFNQVAREGHQFAGPSNSWKAAVPSRFPDLSHNVGMSKDPSQGNIVKINQLSRLAASSGQISIFGNLYQNQIAGITGKTTPLIGFSEQVAPFNFESNTHHTAMVMGNSDLGSSSTRSALPNVQIDNSVMPDQMLNGGGTNGNLPQGGTVNQQPVGDQVINEFLVEQARSRMEQVVI